MPRAHLVETLRDKPLLRTLGEASVIELAAEAAAEIERLRNEVTLLACDPVETVYWECLPCGRLQLSVIETPDRKVKCSGCGREVTL